MNIDWSVVALGDGCCSVVAASFACCFAGTRTPVAALIGIFDVAAAAGNSVVAVVVGSIAAVDSWIVVIAVECFGCVTRSSFVVIDKVVGLYF